MRRKAYLAFALVGTLLFGGCSATTNTSAKTPESENGTENTNTAQSDQAAGETATKIGTHHAEIDIQDHGTIQVELDGDTAPLTVQNFMDLANDGFYDGLTFHRIMEGFMMQGGDPNGDGTGGSDTPITGEFSSNGIENPLSHTRGAISMARTQDKNSASSQFFIVHQDSTFLDGEYACFGYVTDGLDIVDDICENTPVADPESGLVAPENQPVITSITITD